jgi:two-component system LytT family response regulator
MTQIRAILIDDEGHCTRTLKWELEQHCPEVDVVAICHSGEEGLRAIGEKNPDLIFLDIEMPGMNGFEMLEKLGSGSFQVIFCTAYDQYAIRALKLSATDYLLKPVDSNDLQAAVEKVSARAAKAITPEQISELITAMRQPGRELRKIALSASDGLEFVDTDSIMYCESQSNYTNIVLEGGRKVLLSKTLKEIDELLSGLGFFRAHKSYLINLRHVTKYVRGEGGYVVMRNGAAITIARSRKDEFLGLFNRL